MSPRPRRSSSGSSGCGDDRLTGDLDEFASYTALAGRNVKPSSHGTPIQQQGWFWFAYSSDTRAALLLGGGLQSGRVIGDWPGLTQSALFEGRDLKPTTAVEGLVTGALASHFGLDAETLVRTLYPAQAGLKPLII